jgi:hypothetical protein
MLWVYRGEYLLLDEIKEYHMGIHELAQSIDNGAITA